MKNSLVLFSLFFLCVYGLGENHRAIKGPKGERRQRTAGGSGVLQEGKQRSERESQRFADRINREGGQWVIETDPAQKHVFVSALL